MDEYPLWVSGLQLLQPPKIPTSHSVFFDEGPSGGTPYYMEFIAGLYRNSEISSPRFKTVTACSPQRTLIESLEAI